MSEFKTETVSIDGAPSITFEARGDTMRAELAGAKLYAEVRDPVYTDRNLGPAADLRLTDATGFVLADLIVNGCPERTLTENVAGVGAALLWSHWRFVIATPTGQPQAGAAPPRPSVFKYSDECACCDAPAFSDCVVWPQFSGGKLYDECERRMSTKKTMRELIAKSSIGAGLADIKERGIDAHLADVEKGKF